MHSSQNEQDTRHFARFAKVPILEPSDSQEARDFLIAGLELSERFGTPVILRSTTRVSHSRSLVALGQRTPPAAAPGFKKDPPRHVPIPLWGRVMRQKLEVRLGELRQAAETSPLNRIEWAAGHDGSELGIITSGIAYEYVKEVWPEASVLKLGLPWPFPDALLRTFAAGVGRVLVVEELEDFLEEHIKALGIPCEGRQWIPGIGELSPDRLAVSRAAMEGRPAVTVAPVPQAADLPSRPPVLCAGCPHRGIYHALTKFKVVVTGDIGCYSLGVFPPLNRLDTILCMGAGFSMAHGFDKAGEPQKVVGIVGDSTFFHSGITGLLDIVYNGGHSTLIVVDNRTTAMTGHQGHPGTGRTLMGAEVPAVSIEAIARACGVRRVVTVDPYDLANTIKVLKEEIDAPEPSLIISQAPCPLNERLRLGPARHVDGEVCRECGVCLKLGCPAMEGGGGAPRVNEQLCIGCDMCGQVCKFNAIGCQEVNA